MILHRPPSSKASRFVTKAFVLAAFSLTAVLAWNSGTLDAQNGNLSPDVKKSTRASSAGFSPWNLVDGAYRVVPGDVLDIRVFEHDGLSRTFPVPPSGRITLPPVGSLSLVGKTVEELEIELMAGLDESGYIVRPQVSIVVTHYKKRFAYLLEGVQRPQAYELPVDRHLRLTQVLSLGGGLVEHADRKRVKIFRRSEVADATGAMHRPDVVIVDLDQIMTDGRTECDVLIHPGDTIIVPDLSKEERQIFVGGKVKKPGAYPLNPLDELTVFRAIILAGGFDKFASPEDTYLIRKGPDGETAHKLKLDEILKNQLRSDRVLQANDVIWVPESFFGG